MNFQRLDSPLGPISSGMISNAEYELTSAAISTVTKWGGAKLHLCVEVVLMMCGVNRTLIPH